MGFHSDDQTVSVSGSILGKVERLNGQKEFWRLVALGLIVISTLSLMANFWLAFSQNELNTSISRRDCRAEIFAEWSDGIKDVVDAFVDDDNVRLQQANDDLQALGNLEVLYRGCVTAHTEEEDT